MKKANRLIHESSPYLLQHAYNPVDWYPWGTEALERAKSENKPILISIGYSTCHWCHVMERESFENETVAAYMNKHFINIKLDREERPDLDQIYMETCQLINRSGGWPLNCFLLPDGRPYYAGTYYPPEAKHNLPSWIQVLQNMNRAFQQQRKVVEDQADKLVVYFNDFSDQFQDFHINDDAPALITRVELENIFYALRDRFDRVEGGFGNAPKFPSTHAIKFLFSYFDYASNKESIDHALFSMESMAMGGIYDHLVGGFSRYTVDRNWMIPHFEKMLYDNALLLPLLAKAYKISGLEIFKNAADQTLVWLQEEMIEDDLFYAAIDADSEGVEGKFYIWSWNKLKEILSEQELQIAADFYELEPSGNWEGKNILHRNKPNKEVEKLFDLEADDLRKTIGKIKSKLKTERTKRIRPGTDVKQINSWNSLMTLGLLQTAKVFENTSFLKVGVKCFEKLKSIFSDTKNGKLYRLHSKGKVKQTGFLEDYAYYIRLLIQAYEIEWNLQHLEEAKKWLEIVLNAFSAEESPMFYFTSNDQSDIVFRNIEVYDSALPSANAIMCENLLLLGKFFGEEKWEKRGLAMLRVLKPHILKYPTSHGHWADILVRQAQPLIELAIVGNQAKLRYEELKDEIPANSCIMVATEGNQNFPLLYNRGTEGETLIFVCKNYSCHQPVTSVDEAKQLLKEI